MGIDWAAIVDKVPEIAMVLLFSGFTLRLLREFRNYITKQDDDWREHTNGRDAIYLEKLEALGNKQSNGVEIISKDIQAQTGVLTKLCEQMETNDDLLEFIAEDVKTRQIRAN